METIVNSAISIVVALAQILGVIVISIGLLRAMFIFIKNTFAKEEIEEALIDSRLQLGYSFSLGLGFLIGASILKTVVSLTWEDLAKLGAIIALRTILNYFLTREIKELEFPKEK